MIPATSFLASLANAAARSLLLAGVVGGGLWILRVRNVVAQKAAWSLVLAASVAMPVVARWAAQLPWVPEKDTFVVPARLWSRTPTAKVAEPASVAASAYVARPLADVDLKPRTRSEKASRSHASEGSRFPAPTIAHTIEDTASFAASAATAPAPPSLYLWQRAKSLLAWLTPARGLLLLYLALAVALLGRILFGAAAAFRLWRSAKPARIDSLLTAPGVRVRTSRAIASPVTVAQGIVLPADHVDWDTEKLRIVLAHEGSHVRQRDFFLQLAASLHIALFWFNPMAWWLKRKLTDLSETISDGAAVNQAASHACYAQVLLEFAALPRPITIGVAMAHRGHLRSRIEHLLNENKFRQAFSGGRMRLAAAVLMVPVALFAATAMVRVHAAPQQTPPAQAPAPPAQTAPAPAAPVNTPPPSVPSDALAPAAPENTPPAAVVSDDDQIMTVGPGTAVLAGPKGRVSPDFIVIPPSGGWAPGASSAWSADAKAWRNMAKARAAMQADMAKNMAVFNKQSFFRDGFFNDGNSYAYVTGQGKEGIHYSGNWYEGSQDEIDKARKVAHGDFVWFERDGKSYVIDDASTLAELKPMQQQMDDLGKQQEALGKQQEELGDQQEALGKKMEEARIPTPDVSKELSELNAAIAKLNEKKGGTVSQEDLGDIQGKLAEMEGKLGGIEGELGQKQGEIGRQQGELGQKQGELGRQQGQLGRQQGRIAREMDGKVLTLIDESLKNGKARPVE